MQRDCILAIDQGTTSSRCLVVGADGRVLAEQKCEFAQHYPRPGWVEHDLDDIWRSVVMVVSGAMTAVDGGWRRIAAIGITNQRETVGIWDRTSAAPVAPAIVWQCRRTARACDGLREHSAERIHRLTGLTVDPYFSGPKLAWLLDNTEGLRAGIDRLAAGTIDAWLVFRLTGKHCTDYTNASRTMLLDIDRRQWSGELADLLGVPLDLLPEVLPSGAEFGITSGGDGLPKGIPVTAVMGDQQAALFGQGCHGPGKAKNTYGTGCFLLANTGADRVDSGAGLLTTLACDERGNACYALEGSVFIAGAVVQWLRDGLGIIDRSEQVEALARTVPDTAGVHLVPAFVGLGAPYWDADARGAITGLTRGATRGHIARAALEAIAHQSADVIDVMRAEGAQIEQLRVDGGASGNDLLMQMQADLANVTVLRPANAEMTALGAAYLAGQGIGLWNRPWDGQQGAQTDLFRPDADAERRKERRRTWREAVARVRSS